MYKVLQRWQNDLCSAWDCRMTYPPRTWVEAPAGGIFVFQDIERAKEYARSPLDDLTVWVCETEEVEPAPFWILDVSLIWTDELIAEYWASEPWKEEPRWIMSNGQARERPNPIGRMPSPIGSFIAQRIYLMEEV